MPEVCRPRGPGPLRPSPPPTAHRHQHRCPRRGPWPLLLQLPRALSTAGQRGLGHGRGGGPRARSGACFLCSCSASERTWPAVVAGQPQGAPGLGRTVTPMASPGPRASIRWAPGTVEIFVGAGGRPRGCGAWGPGGSPGQGPRRLEPSSQEGLGQATPGWEAGGTSAAGPRLPLPGAHVEQGCPGDGEPRVCVEPDRGGRAAFPRGGWRRHPGTPVVPGQVRWGRSSVEGDALCHALRWHGSGRVGGAAASGRVAGACLLPTRVCCQLDCGGPRRAPAGRIRVGPEQENGAQTRGRRGCGMWGRADKALLPAGPSPTWLRSGLRSGQI